MDKRQTANRGLLEWVDSMVVAAVLLALVFTLACASCRWTAPP